MEKKLDIQPSCCSGNRMHTKENSTEHVKEEEKSQIGLETTQNIDIEIKRAVRERYGNIAKDFNSNCGCGSGSGSASDSLPNDQTLNQYCQTLGYSEKELQSIPLDTNMGLGCGNPVALASIQPGEIVVDLGSGGGIDCFLAARKTGETGRVIGVDMTPSMIERSRMNLEKNKGEYPNLEFRLGEIEHLPIGDNSADVIISNCVINLSTDKGQVFKEAYRVLKSGGRMMISDIMITKELPEIVQTSLSAYSGCVAGAMLKDDYFQKIRNAGFKSIEIISDRAAGDITKDIVGERKQNQKKPKIVLGGKEIEHDFTFEEVESISQSIRSIHFSAIK